MADDLATPDRPERRPSVPSALARVLGARVPLWILLAVVAAGGVLVAVLTLTSDEVALGPAVTRAERVEVEILLCNEVVDAEGMNPRQAELDLQDELREIGAGEAKVRIDRRDCGSDAATTRPDSGT